MRSAPLMSLHRGKPCVTSLHHAMMLWSPERSRMMMMMVAVSVHHPSRHPTTDYPIGEASKRITEPYTSTLAEVMATATANSETPRVVRQEVVRMARENDHHTHLLPTRWTPRTGLTRRWLRAQHLLPHLLLLFLLLSIVRRHYHPTS